MNFPIHSQTCQCTYICAWNVPCSMHTSKFRQVSGRSSCFDSQGMLDSPKVLDGASWATMHSSPCFEIFCAEFTHQNSGKSREDVVFQQSGHVWFPWNFARSLCRHITYDLPIKLGAHWSVFQNILCWANTSKFRQVRGRCAHFNSQGMFDFPDIWHGASYVILHVICPKTSVHTGLSFEIFCAELTPKFW
jgi:hypothetical protein